MRLSNTIPVALALGAMSLKGVSGVSSSNSPLSNLQVAQNQLSKVAGPKETMLDGGRGLRNFSPDTYDDSNTANVAHKSAAIGSLIAGAVIFTGALALCAIKACCERICPRTDANDAASSQTSPAQEMTSTPRNIDS